MTALIEWIAKVHSVDAVCSFWLLECFNSVNLLNRFEVEFDFGFGSTGSSDDSLDFQANRPGHCFWHVRDGNGDSILQNIPV